MNFIILRRLSVYRISILVLLLFPFSLGMSGHESQETIFDGSKNVLGIQSVQGEDGLDAAIDDGCLHVGVSFRKDHVEFLN